MNPDIVILLQKAFGHPTQKSSFGEKLHYLSVIPRSFSVRGSFGFSASAGMTQERPKRSRPGMRLCWHSLCTRLSDTPHLYDASRADIYPFMLDTSCGKIHKFMIYYIRISGYFQVDGVNFCGILFALVDEKFFQMFSET